MTDKAIFTLYCENAALQGWPGVQIWCQQEANRTERDFNALNRGWVDLGLVSLPEQHAYRRVYDVRKKEGDHKSIRKAPLLFPANMVFGKPPRLTSTFSRLLYTNNFNFNNHNYIG